MIPEERRILSEYGRRKALHSILINAAMISIAFAFFFSALNWLGAR